MSTNMNDEKINVDALLAGATVAEVQALPMIRPIHIGSIFADDRRNVRIRTGQVIGGILVTKDSRDLNGLTNQIRIHGGIHTPLLVSERFDGTFHLLRGFRRFNAAIIIRSTEPGSDLCLSLDTLPCDVRTGLTKEQEDALINDQDGLDFLASEVCNSFLTALDSGEQWQKIAYRNYTQLGRITGASEQVMAVRQAPNREEADKKIVSWLNKFIGQYWLQCWKIGGRIRELLIQQYLYKDGLMPADTKPQYKITTAQMVKLWSAYKNDVVNGTVDKVTRIGKEMQEHLDKDCLWVKPAPSTPVKKFKDKDVFETTLSVHTPLVQDVMQVAYKDHAAPQSLDILNNFAKCLDEYRAVQEMIPADSPIHAIFGTTVDLSKVTAFLASSVVAGSEPKVKGKTKAK